MRLSLRVKLILLLVFVVTVGMVLMTYLNISSQVQARMDGMKREARSVATVFGLNYAQSMLTGQKLDNINQLSTRLWESAAENAVFLVAYDVDGHSIFQYPPAEQIEDQFHIQPIPPRQNRLLLRSKLEVFGRWVRGNNLYDVLVPIRYHSNDFGVIRLGFDTHEVSEERNQIIYKNALMTAVFWLLAALSGIFFTSKITRPLSELVSVANRLGKGDLEARSDINTGDEIGELSKDFNIMADRIKARIKEREQSLAQLQAIQRVGTMLNESGSPDVFFPVLDEAMQTLYDVDIFLPVIWDGEVFVAPYSRPQLEQPLFIPSHAPALEAVEDEPRAVFVEPEDDWPEPLQQVNWAYPLKVGDDLNGVLYMKLSRELDEQEQEWMFIWGTQVCQAVRGMVLEGKISEYQEKFVEATRDMLKKKIRDGFVDFLLITQPDFTERRNEEGIFYGEDFSELLKQDFEAAELPVAIVQTRLNQFLILARELDDWEKSTLEKTVKNFSEANFELEWFEGEPDIAALQEFLLT
ncbi:MAG: HAMP domain-containing protein [bacterium]